MTIVFQSSPILKKISNLLPLLVWTTPLTLSSLSYLLSLLPSKIPSNPASPDYTPASPLQTTNNPTTVPDVASPASTGLQFSISLRENNQPKPTDGLPPFSSFLSDVRPLPSRPNRLKLQPDQSVLGRQHRREYYTNHTPEQNDPVSVRKYNTVSNKNSPDGKYYLGIADAKNTRFKAALSLLNDWSFLHRRSLHFLADVAKPSGAGLPPSISIFQ